MSMRDDRLVRQLEFILELDKLKTVLRRTRLTDDSRHENSAEHSWHLALMALLLAEYSDRPVEVPRVVALLLVHDIVEIEAGDTFAYDAAGVLDQAEREARAADHLFGLLPEDQAAALRELWDEFEARRTPEARFAAAMDRLQPMLHNLQLGGGTWQSFGISMDQILMRAGPIVDASTELWRYVQAELRRAYPEGRIPPRPTSAPHPSRDDK